MKKCTIKDCESIYLAKGMCRAHYLRFWRKGKTDLDVMRGFSPFHRVVAKIKKQGECLIFTGCLTKHGYGHIRCGQKMRMAHRVMYENYKGKVPAGLELDHLCRIRSCVNPDHLEAVTHVENIRRGISGHDHQKRKRNLSGQFIKMKAAI